MDNMNKILTAAAVIFPAVLMLAACDNTSEVYTIGKNNPTVTTLEVSEEQIGEDRVTLTGSVRWEQSTSDHSFDGRFAISENPDFPAGETDTLYNNWNNISQEDTTTHYYDCSIEGLKRGTTYYYAFSITDDIVEVSGETKSFTTLGQAPDNPDNPTDGRTITLPNEIGPHPVDIEMESDWEISNKTAWFSVTPLSGDKGLYTIYINLLYVNTSSDSEKSGEFIVRYDDGREIVYTVILPPASIDELNLVMPEGVEFSVDAEGGDYDTFIPFIIENYGYEYFESHGEPALWIENGADWLSNVEYAYLEYGDDCTGYINLTAAPNTSGSDRTGNVTFGFRSQSYSINITQAAKGEGPIMETDFIISVTKITNSTAHVEITPKDTEIPFLVFVGEATKVAGLTDDELFLSDLRAMQATAHDFGMTLPDYVDYIKQIGYASGDQTDLSSATEYAVWCYHIDNFGTAPERISNIVMNTFTTD